MDSCLYNIKSIAEKLDVSVATINRRIKEDEHFPKPFLIGGKNFWSSEQLNDYIQAVKNGCYQSAA